MKITDLNAYLFEQLDRLTNDDLKGEELDTEIKRAQAVSNTSRTIIQNSQLALNATKFLADQGCTITRDKNAALQLLVGGSDAK